LDLDYGRRKRLERHSPAAPLDNYFRAAIPAGEPFHVIVIVDIQLRAAIRAVQVDEVWCHPTHPVMVSTIIGLSERPNEFLKGLGISILRGLSPYLWAHRLGRHHRRIVPYSQATGGEHGAGGFAPDANFRVPLRRAAAGLGVEAFPGPVATSQSSLPTAAGLWYSPSPKQGLRRGV